jgi:small subunit ribosomal protein S6
MRRYETIVIIDPDLPEDDRSSLLARIRELIPQQAGVLIQEDVWGTKKLAYEIKKKPRGFYVRFDYCGLGSLVDELERSFRIDDRVMKYLTVLLDSDADVEQIQAGIAAAETTEPADAAAGGTSTEAASDDETAEPAGDKETDATESVTEEAEEE